MIAERLDRSGRGGGRLRAPFAAALALASVALCASASAEGAKSAKDDPLERFRSSLAPAPDTTTLNLRQDVYVPVYSSIFGGAGLARLDLSVTLSIRNASESMPLVVERIDYYDTAGAVVERYLRTPIAIRPLGTIEIFIPIEDVRGGTGPNFIVRWAATGAIAEPVIEAVMTGASGTRGFAFVVPGRPVRVIDR
jgi:Protein of unknown function (DUF3124)